MKSIFLCKFCWNGKKRNDLARNNEIVYEWSSFCIVRKNAIFEVKLRISFLFHRIPANQNCVIPVQMEQKELLQNISALCT